VVLWTRLAPEPLAPDGKGGMPPEPVTVRYELARDPDFHRVIHRGHVEATPELAHSVHAVVRRLRPGFEYFYRFRVGSDVSPVGRTRTTPAGPVDSLRFALASCQRWQDGFYTALGHIADDEDLDLVVFVGDYIYENGIGATGGARRLTRPDASGPLPHGLHDARALSVPVRAVQERSGPAASARGAPVDRDLGRP